MFMKSILFIIFMVAMFVFGHADENNVKSKQGKSENTEKQSIYSNEWVTNDTSIIYKGNVEIKFGTYRIYADYVEFIKKSRTVKVKGQVTLVSEETVITGKDLIFNLKTKTGIMKDNFGLMQPTINFNTNELNFIDEKTVKFRKFNFSSCSQRIPRWKITCSSGKIKKEKYIEMKNAVLRIKKIPVFYFPYMRYPIKKGGKATGFLFPNFGTGSKKGFYIQNAFFLNLKPNVDLTFYGDYFSKAGIGLGEEFRYLFKNMSGNIKYYRFGYKEGNEVKPEGTSDYYLDVRHSSSFDFLNTVIKVNINTQSDPTFLRLFSNSFDTSLFANFQTSFSLNSRLSVFNLSVNASKRETYYTYRESSRIVKYMPSIKLNMYQKKIWIIPGYFSFKSAYERVSRSGVSYEDEPDYTSEFVSQRVNFSPSYTLNLIKLPWLSTTINLASYQNFYPKSYKSGTKTIVDEPLHLGYNTVNVSIKGPIFYKIFNFKMGKIKHLFEPQIDYKYSSQMDDEALDRLIKVDRYDYPQFSVLSLKLSTRILYKKDSQDISPREVMRLSISQRYYFEPELASRGRKINGEYPEFSELASSLRLGFFKNITFDFSLAYNYYLKKFQRVNASLLFTGQDSPLTGRLSYSSYVSPFMPANFYFNRDLITGALDFKIEKFPIQLSSAVSYDLTEKVFRYGSAVAKLDLQCIKLNFEFKVFSNIMGSYAQFRFGFSLGNMGNVSDILGGRKQ